MFFFAFSQPSILSVGGPPGERVSTGKTTGTARPRAEAHQSAKEVNQEGQLRHIHPLDGV